MISTIEAAFGSMLLNHGGDTLADAVTAVMLTLAFGVGALMLLNVFVDLLGHRRHARSGAATITSEPEDIPFEELRKVA